MSRTNDPRKARAGPSQSAPTADHDPPVVSASPAPAYQASQGPTGVAPVGPRPRLRGYTLVGVGGTTDLVDMSGSVVHTWKVGTNPSSWPNGHVLDARQGHPAGSEGSSNSTGTATSVWAVHRRRARTTRRTTTSCASTTRSSTPNHVVHRQRHHQPNAQALAAAPTRHGPKDADKAQVTPSVEVDASGNGRVGVVVPGPPRAGRQRDMAELRGAGKTVAERAGAAGRQPPRGARFQDWLHCNSMDYTGAGPGRDQRRGREFYVIDHGGTVVAGRPRERGERRLPLPARCCPRDERPPWSIT